jgi:hypothetical protein
MEHFIKIARDFSMSPGARYRTDGSFSGEEFFETLLKPKFETARNKGEKLIIDLDGTYGYATSFLSEAFNRLANDFQSDVVWNNISLISKEEPYLIDEIKEYVFDAEGAH